MKTVSYKSEVLNYLHPEGVFGHLLDAMLYRRKIEFLQKIRTNIKRAGFNNTMALRFLGKMRARISGWRLMFKSKRMSMIEAHRNIEALVAASAWELEMPATGETRPAREKYSPPQNPRAFGRASENLAFATPHEWTRSIHSHLPAHKKGESYSSVEYGGAPKLKYDPNGRGEYSQSVHPNVAVNGVSFVYGAEGPDQALVSATLRSQIGGAMKTGVPFVIKFDNASPSFVAVIINAAAAVYSENPSAYLQAVRAFVVNGKSHSAASVIYAAAAEKEKQNLGRALAARANGAARTA